MQRVVVHADHFAISEQIQFDGGKVTIKPESAGLLDEIAAAIKAHSEIKKIRVEGHTAMPRAGQEQETPASRMTMSTDRANNVISALGERGVEKKMFVAQGFGDTRPLATNQTNQGQAKNRRVEFIILEPASKAADK